MGGVIEREAVTELIATEVAERMQRDAAPGLTIRFLEGPEGAMLVAVADLVQFHAGVEGIGQNYRHGVNVFDVMQDENVLLLAGSGFVAELNGLTPVGLLQINAETVSKIQRHGYTRVLGLADHRIGVVDHLNYQRGMFPSALQVGPGVVEEGRLDISERDLERKPFFRALVGTCGDRALFAASLEPMHLYTAGAMLLAFSREQALGCDEIVNLAGDREAVLAVRGADGSVTFVGNPRTSKAALVSLRSLIR